MTEEQMELRPMSFADVVAGVDELGDIAMPYGENPSGHERGEEKKTGFGKVALKTDEQCLKVPRKIPHGRPSLVEEQCDDYPYVAKEAGFLPSSNVRNSNLATFEKYLPDFNCLP